jgi:hypothetical protein
VRTEPGCHQLRVETNTSANAKARDAASLRLLEDGDPGDGEQLGQFCGGQRSSDPFDLVGEAQRMTGNSFLSHGSDAPSIVRVKNCGILSFANQRTFERKRETENDLCVFEATYALRATIRPSGRVSGQS